MHYEKNKRIYRLACTAFLVALATGLFINMWAGVYNFMTVFPYYFKGFLMLGFMYFVLASFFIWLLNGSQIGYLRRKSVLLSQLVSILAVNFILYLVTCLLATFLVPPGGFIILSVVDVLLFALLTRLFNRCFDRIFPALDMLLIYGLYKEAEVSRMTAGWQGKYRITKSISIEEGRHRCIAAIDGFKAVVLCGLDVADRNVIAEYCQEKGVLTYFSPRISDMLFQDAQGLKFFDSAPGSAMDLIFGPALGAAGRFSLIGYMKKVYRGDMETLYERVSEKLERGEKEFIITANPETLMNGLETEEFDRILLAEDTLVIPDGIGLIKALEISGYGSYGRITGIDFASALFKMANIKGLSVFLYGGSREVISGMELLMKKEYPHARLLGAVNGYDRDPDEVMRQAASLSPDIVMVALGVPAQEMLIARHIGSFDNGIFIGVGGSFDVLSGRKKRAPEIFIKFNLEWLYRISVEPVRIKRFVRSNLRFFREVMRIRSIK